MAHCIQRSFFFLVSVFEFERQVFVIVFVYISVMSLFIVCNGAYMDVIDSYHLVI